MKKLETCCPVANPCPTHAEREAEQIRQSLERLTPKGFKVYEHGNQGWPPAWFVDDGHESHGPFDDAEEALQEAVRLDNYDPSPTESVSDCGSSGYVSEQAWRAKRYGW